MSINRLRNAVRHAAIEQGRLRLQVIEPGNSLAVGEPPSAVGFEHGVRGNVHGAQNTTPGGLRTRGRGAVCVSAPTSTCRPVGARARLPAVPHVAPRGDPPSWKDPRRPLGQSHREVNRRCLRSAINQEAVWLIIPVHVAGCIWRSDTDLYLIRFILTGQVAPLPEFDRPPVSEVAISAEFDPLPKWKSSHAGLYWAQINATYPLTEVQPPLLSVPERFGEEMWRKPAVQVSMIDPDSSRFWFFSEQKDQLIQVQRDRFIMNWRRLKDDDVYPTYRKVLRARFVDEWNRFKAFVSKNDLGTFHVQQCELTYVNDIAHGNGWTNVDELLALFSCLWKRSKDGFLPTPEFLTTTGSFLMPEQKGRLRFVAQPVRRQSDDKMAYQLQITARGRPAASTDEAVLAWIDLGHEWIVRGFVDLTSQRAHELWGRRP